MKWHVRTLSLLAGAALCANANAALFDTVEQGSIVSVPAFSYAPDKSFRNDLKLRRIEVYAPDAKVFVVGPAGAQEIPRSDLMLFVGDPQEEPQRMYITVSADGKRFDGAIFDVDGTYAINGQVDGGALRVETSKRVEDQGSEFACAGSPGLPISDAQKLQQQLNDIAVSKADVKGGATRQAVVAVDTDNELMNLKFGNNTTTANNYIAALFAGMNVFYERDLNVRLQLGTVFLRPSTTPDPYPSVTDSDIGNQLDEFGEFWRVTPALSTANVPRAFAAQLSGKLSSNNSASGIAWILTSGSYCTASGQVFGGGTFGHYSTTRVFKFNGATAASDVSIVGHELGHNFGAAHTHCSSSVSGGTGSNANQLIDRCFNAETIGGGVCHGGAVSCPTDNSISGRGSLMSYCNFGAPNGANCGQVLQEFHPAHQAFLSGRITTNVGSGCITPLGSNIGPQFAAATPANNSTTNMGGGTVGAQLTRNITYSVSGGSGSGTTQLTCSLGAGSGSGNLTVVSGSPQTVAVGGSAAAVIVRFTLTGSAQSRVVNCAAVRQGAATTNFSYTFTANAGTAASPSRIFCSGFEPGQTGVCAN